MLHFVALVAMAVCGDDGLNEDAVKTKEVEKRTDVAWKEAEKVFAVLKTDPGHISMVASCEQEISIRFPGSRTAGGLKEDDIKCSVTVKRRSPKVIAQGGAIEVSSKVKIEVAGEADGKAVILTWVDRRTPGKDSDEIKKAQSILNRPGVSHRYAIARHDVALGGSEGFGQENVSKPGTYSYLCFVAIFPVDGSEPRLLDADFVESTVE
jgi:hypothetical protein